MKQSTPRFILLSFVLLVVFSITINLVVTRKTIDRKRRAEISSVKSRSGRDEPDEETKGRLRREAISQAAQQWYEKILDRHPDLRPVFRDVPDERNGYLQFVRLAGLKDTPKLPEEIADLFRGRIEWNPALAKSWLAEHGGYLRNVLQIAELPDRSAKGVSLKMLHETRGLAGEVTAMLQAASRVEMEGGNPDAAARYMKASMSLADHFVDIEVPTMLGEIIAIDARSRGQKCFRENFLPGLDPAALDSWNDLLFRKEEPAAEFSRIMIGEWNYTLRELVLPPLLDKQNIAEFRIPDMEGFSDTYAEAMRKSARGISALGPDRFDIVSAELVMPGNSLDPETAQVVHGALSGLKDISRSLGRSLTRSTMEAAAVAIVSGREMPVDPISGAAFSWNPETRVLSAPEGAHAIDPIQVP